MTQQPATAPDIAYDDLRALFINCTLKRSPEPSNTQGLVDVSAAIMRKHGVAGRRDPRRRPRHRHRGVARHDASTAGPPTTGRTIYEKVLAADILVLAGPDLARRQQLGHQAGHRAALRRLAPAQRRRASTSTTAGSAAA